MVNRTKKFPNAAQPDAAQPDAAPVSAVPSSAVPLDEPLNLPPRPTLPPVPAFPLVACLAPLVAAGVIYLVTTSAFALLFGLLSPIIAIGSLVDGRRSRGKQIVRDQQEHARLLASLRAIIADRHERLRVTAQRRNPGAAVMLAFPAEAGLWSPGASLVVSLGRATLASGVQLGGARDPLEERELRDWAARLTGAPLTTDVAGGLALIGPPALTRALARSVIVQLCFALRPHTCALVVPAGAAWEWASALPHPTGHGAAHSEDAAAVSCAPGSAGQAAGRSAPGYRLVVEETNAGSTGGDSGCGVGGSDVNSGCGFVTLTLTGADLPRFCTTVIRVHGPQRATVVRSPVLGPEIRFEPELISAQQALDFAHELRERAGAAGLLSVPAALPNVVAFAALGAGRAQPSGAQPSGAQPRGALDSRAGGETSRAIRPRSDAGLPCPVGMTAHGLLELDLVAQGPHAVVGGTTGSGKSELLVTWVASLAACFGPSVVSFLLVDFKGGAAFGALAHLPHCVGVITDLDALQATRALESLAAELRHREAVLRDAGVRDVRELPGTGASGTKQAVPRLIIVVDEFATMLTTFPDLHALFVDIGARGRSLGVHLILCTQRPAGVVRDALLANCSLRLSLRVNNRADSEAVIGTEAAAALPAALPGRCLVSTGQGAPQLGQIATTTTTDLETLLAHSGSAAELDEDAFRPRRPWLDPLPRILRESDLRHGFDVPGMAASEMDVPRIDVPGDRACFRFGLVDEPDKQRYRVARYTPAADGHLLVLGDARSGKTSLLQTLEGLGSAGYQTQRVGADIEQLWDALDAASRAVEAGVPGSAVSGFGVYGFGVPGRTGSRLLLLDDVDSVYARWSADHQFAALDMLGVLLRDGPRHGVYVALTMQRLVAGLRGISTLCRSRLLLSVHDRDEYRDLGGDLRLFDTALPPGGGYWQGARMQVLTLPAVPSAEVPSAEVPSAEVPSAGGDPAPVLELRVLLRDAPLIVISGTPVRTLTVLSRALGSSVRLMDLGGGNGLGTGPARLEVRDATAGTVIVGDPDTWQAQWALLAALRSRATLIFDGCSPTDLRQLIHRRELPPPLLAGRSRVWVLSPDGHLTRGALPNGPLPNDPR